MSAIALFEQKQVRRAWNQAEAKWYFAIADVIAVLTESVDPGAYWRKLKERLKKEGNQTVTNCHALKMTAADGKQRMTDVADTEQLFRLIQSIPSPRAELFKLWLAKVGYERLEEIENPELAAKRTREIYQQKGYSEEWIEKRMRGIAVRDELTDEWKKRGVKQQREFAILTAEISKATFGMTPAEYKDFKALANPKENLRTADARGSKLADQLSPGEIRAYDLAGKRPTLAGAPGGAQAPDTLGCDSTRCRPEHGFRAGTGADRADSRDTRPDSATRFVETARGVLSYSELAPLLADRVTEIEASVSTRQRDSITEATVG